MITLRYKYMYVTFGGDIFTDQGSRYDIIIDDD